MLGVDGQADGEEDHEERACHGAVEQDRTSAETLDSVDSGGSAGHEDEDDTGGRDGCLVLRHAGTVDQEIRGIVGDNVVAVCLLKELDGDTKPDTPRCVDRRFVGPGHEEVLESELDVSLSLQGCNDVLAVTSDCLRCQGDLVDTGEDFVGVVVVSIRIEISRACGIWLGNHSLYGLLTYSQGETGS